MPLDTLSSTMRTLVGGEEVSKFKDGDEQYSVTLRLDDQFRNDPDAMGDLFVPASGGRLVRVTDVASLTLGQRAGLHRPLQPDAPDLGQREPRPPEDHAGRRDQPRRGTRWASWT